jgi:hypothetical protein
MAGKIVQVPAALLQRFVSHIEKTGALLERVEQDTEQAKAAAPETVDLLIKQGLVDASYKIAAVEALGSHAKAIETLRRTATHVSARSMGAPAGDMTKAASDGSSTLDDADQRFNVAMGFGM